MIAGRGSHIIPLQPDLVVMIYLVRVGRVIWSRCDPRAIRWAEPEIRRSASKARGKPQNLPPAVELALQGPSPMGMGQKMYRQELDRGVLRPYLEPLPK